MVKICVVFDTYGRNGLGGKTVLRVHLPIDVRGHSLQHEECPMGKKGFLIATSAGFAAAATMSGAQAADMPIKAPRYIEPSASWAGWYIGGERRAAWQPRAEGYRVFLSHSTLFCGVCRGCPIRHRPRPTLFLIVA